MNLKLRHGLALAGVTLIGLVGVAAPAFADPKPFSTNGFCGWDPWNDEGVYGHATANVTGWVKDSYLSNGGSYVTC